VLEEFKRSAKRKVVDKKQDSQPFFFHREGQSKNFFLLRMPPELRALHVKKKREGWWTCVQCQGENVTFPKFFTKNYIICEKIKGTPFTKLLEQRNCDGKILYHTCTIWNH
jgi:hypothetical protein